ncbi:MAG: M4 family metallopeptidase [Vicinamibacteria bacterium]|nr:M4 family metallopeptidase [Vicinamibacteria bacterium]
MTARLAVSLALTAVALAAPAGAVHPAAQTTRREVRLAVGEADAVGPWSAYIDALLRDGRLDLGAIADDTIVAGRSHQRLVQRHQGLPVFGGELVRQLAGEGVVSIFGRLYDDVVVDVSPTIEPGAAASRALALWDAIGTASADEATLGVLPTDDGRYVLVWRLQVRLPRDLRLAFVNAHSGVVEREGSMLRTQLPNIGTGGGVFGDPRKVSAAVSSQGFELRDQSRPGPMATFDFAGSPSRLLAFLQFGALFDSDIAVDGDNAWTDGVAVDAHAYQGWTYDYFFARAGRRGIDDRNGQTSVIVHPVARADAGSVDEDTRGLFVNNALYVGNRTLMFGDGDGVTFDAFAGALDVVAHEWAHGVTEYGADLLYRDEPGALNESFSDIMGASVEFFYQTPGSGRQRADWLIAEDITKTAAGYIRSMSDPISVGDPDHYSLVRFIGTSIDNGGIHINCGVPNQAYYLAVAGGTNRVSGLRVQGIGLANRERMERIFYRGFVYFLGSSSSFHDARVATIQAAVELYGSASAETTAVTDAWTAVGVL